ncbi:MAG: S41 family peptidase, partial [Polyangiales bacterium]
SEDRWNGPVAAIVDGGTASAAEMIAGALHAYRRGPVVGTATYGKGCAQEYVDDVTGVGVLRLTTLLFALPDGSPVQRVGIRPDIAIKLPPPIGVKDHEADLLRAAPTWTGPDVRDAKRVVEISWPPSKAIGPCKDEAICRALRAVSSRAELAKR